MEYHKEQLKTARFRYKDGLCSIKPAIVRIVTNSKCYHLIEVEGGVHHIITPAKYIELRKARLLCPIAVI